MKRIFDCGHKGLGKFCHRCCQAATLSGGATAQQSPLPINRGKAPPRATRQMRRPDEIERLHVLKAAAANASIDLSAARSQPAVLERAVDILTRLAAGTHPLSLGGKKLNAMRGNFSIPVGRRHRIVIDGNSLEPTVFMTHEAYNGVV
ncbi:MULTISPECIES: hypothetical protein [unclassified Paraburkholderia]|uniref:DUF7682 family zinc-binding protein n=1 Tax=unclassified Paraburkholderia TaxID=2615204 RepID=UPI002AB0895C|nr:MULTISPECIES: hypothetical protein [unclassified Paraburkholderia]